MVNQIKADFYKLSRSKVFWFTQIALLIFVALCIYNGVFIQSGYGDAERERVSQYFSEVKRTGCTSIQVLLNMGRMVIYIMFPIFKLMIGNELTSQTYKNILSTGQSRKRYLLTKYIEFSIVVLIEFLVYLLSGFFIGTCLHGIGQLNESILQIIAGFLLVYFSMIIFFAMMMLVLYLSFSNVAALLFGVFYSIITLFLLNPSLHLDGIKYFNFWNWSSFLPIDFLTFYDLGWMIFSGSLVLFLSISGSVAIFRKKDL